MKKTLIALGGLVVLAVVALVVAPLLVPAETLRTRLAEAVRGATGRDLAITGNVGLRLLPTASFHAAGITFGNAAWAATPEMARIKSIEVSLRILPLLIGRIEVASLVLAEPEIALETGPDGRGNWVFDKPDRPAPTTAPSGAKSATDISLADVRIENGRASFRDGRAGTEQRLEKIGLRLSLPGLDQKLTASGSATWNGEEMRLTIEAAAPGALLAGGEGAIEIRLEAAPLRLAFNGRLQGLPPRRTEGTIDIASPSLRRLAAWTGGKVALPGTEPGAFAIKGRINAEGPETRFTEATIAFDAIRATGDLRVNTAGARPRLAGTLAVGVLDLNPYLPDTKPAPKPAAPLPSTETGWSEAPIDLAALGIADVELDLAAEEILYRKLRIERPRLAVRLLDGKLNVDLREITLYRGQGKATLALDSRASPPAFSLTTSLAGTDIDGLLAGAIGLERLAGIGHFDLAITSRGASQRALIAALAGKGGLDLADGRIKGVDLLSIARKALPGGSSTAASAGTSFGSLIGSFTITNGILFNEDLQLKSSLAPITGAGQVDLPRRTIDYRIVAQIAGALKIPVTITGPWDQISYQPDGGKLLDQLKPAAPGNLLRGLLPKP
ncbi:MAG: AsmA family protein [Alphaproteobacteria bacterium]|nr:AsmA family protein [Alphaproteobacteria bacterium]